MILDKIELSGVDEIEAERLEDEYGSLRLTIKTEDGTTVEIDAGRFYDDATALRDMLREAADDLDRYVITGWEDVPDESDAFVSVDRGRYYVTIEGVSVRQFGSNEFPTETIATIELARAMSESGCFPNAWSVNDRGNTFDIGEAVRRYHDEGGTGLIDPLPGATFADGAEVLVEGMGYDGALRAEVLRDYGDAGITFVLSGDDEVRWSDDRELFAACDEEDDDA